MKTQTDTALIGLVLVVVAAIAFGIWSTGQVDMAAAQVNAGAAAGQLPMAAVIGGQVSGWALKTLLGVAALAIATGLIAWARQWWRQRKSGNWKGGPNAQWREAGSETHARNAPRQVSDAELMRAMLMQQMMGRAGGGGRGQRPTPNGDDDLNIDF